MTTIIKTFSKRWIVYCILMTAINTQALELKVNRIGDGPIIYPELNETIGHNIQGPSVIRVPSWLKSPLGKYYMYFADHKGKYIRLAYADHVQGPWKIYEPGTLTLSDSGFPQERQPLPFWKRWYLEYKFKSMGVDVDNFPHDPEIELTTPHIASPDVHVDNERKQIRMYFHGLKKPAVQVTRLATSTDGIHFTVNKTDLGKTYFRSFDYKGNEYAIAMPGQIYKKEEGKLRFIKGPLLFDMNMRHSGVWITGDTLNVFWSQVGDAPESILLSQIDLSAPWEDWKESKSQLVLKPEFKWEGAHYPVEPSHRSHAINVNQLRDPYVFEDEGNVYLFYCVAGESGIALAKIQNVKEATIAKQSF